MACLQVDPTTVKEVTNETEETTHEESPAVDDQEKLATEDIDFTPTEPEIGKPKEVVSPDQEDSDQLIAEEGNEEDKAAVPPIEEDSKWTEKIENEGRAEEDDEDEE